MNLMKLLLEIVFLPVFITGSLCSAQNFKKISTKFPGVELYKTAKGWSVKLPENLVEGHESYFARVTKNYLDYLKNRNMPAWEVPNMLAKYYTTTKALETALKKR